MVHRLIKPRTPLDCPICRLCSSAVRPAPAPVHPWGEVKSRRGAPKRIPTEGFACPNQQCAYFGITDAHIHALVGDGKHGCAEQIQTFRCQTCRTTFSARRDTPLYRLKTPSHQIAIVLSALAEGLDPSAAERVFGYRQATITTWLSRAGEHAHTLHERFFCSLYIPHLQLDELRTRLRSANQILWLWLAIDPCTKILPVLQLGPRTQNLAQSVIHSLRQILAPGCLPLFTSDGLNLYFYAAPGPFWTLAPGVSPRAQSPPVAGGDGLDLRPGEKMLPATQAGSGHACNATGDRGRSQSRFTEIRLLWEVEHGFHLAGESDCPTWRGSARAPHLGDGSADPTFACTPGMVASLLPLCAFSPRTASGTRAAARAEGQTGDATLPATNPCHGSWDNTSTMDGARGALSPLAASFRLR